MNLRPTTFTRSDELWRRAQGLIPAGTQTLSKGPTQFVQGVSPKYLERGAGSHVWDVDGNEYIDYPMGLGPIILGHAHPVVNAAVIEQVERGSTFTHMHPLEVEVAELMRDSIPHLEMIRYGKNGSDATTGAVRCARAFTKRDKIASCGYHSWHDWYVAGTSRDSGVPAWNKAQLLKFPYNDIDSLHALFRAHPDDIALVIMEPVTFAPPEEGYLEAVRELTHRYGAVLCFDEVITGFRWHLGGASAYFGVEPDISTYGKALSNGFPLSAIGGKAKYMRVFDEIFMSGTYGGEVISLAAAKATITFMRENPVIEHLWRSGEKIKAGYNALVAEYSLSDYTSCIGMGPRTFIQFQDPEGKIPMLHLKSLFQQEVVQQGILFNGNHMVTYAHSEADIDYTLQVYRHALQKMAQVLDSGQPLTDFLLGAPIEPVFR
jgi:glutamate-1-semialdehyde 2,1-aminomutase/spore coat polysaccharide biosynthesis protein SpsF